jgi:hypothetical protein
MAGMKESHSIVGGNIMKTPTGQTQYRGRILWTLGVRDKVVLSIKNLVISCLSHMLYDQHRGPYIVGKTILQIAYNLDLPSSIQIVIMFHQSLLYINAPQTR